MIDWTQPMAQTFEFCEVDPDTWQDARRLLEVKGGELSFDEGEDTGGHATFKTSEPLGETYVRTYLVAEQEGRPRVRVPLGTFLAQTSSKSHDGASAEYSVEAYTPLLELADGLAQLNDAEEQVSQIKSGEWYVLDRSSTVSFVTFEQYADRMDAIARVFPVFFFLVAALVASTTMTRRGH